MSEFEHLLHPELLLKAWPVGGAGIARSLDNLAAEVSQEPRLPTPLSIVIRTLNEAPKLEGLLEDIAVQKVGGEVEIIVVDNESTDGTPQLARGWGAEVVTIPRERFTHPISLNMGMLAASHSVVFSMVGHSNLPSDQYLHSGLRHFEGQYLVGGVYGPTYPGSNLSNTERLLQWTWAKPRPVERIQKAGMGVFGANSLAVNKDILEELGGFDERYERGGEDTHLAGRMLELGQEVIRDPNMAMHHSHGLGPINSIRQWRQFLKTLKEPEAFDQKQWANRRPDLDFS